MYLRGNKWTMTRRPKRRASPWRIALLLILIGGALYVNQVVVPATPPLFVATVTPTRSPESFVNQAEQYYQEGKLAQAVEAYQDAVVADPNNPANYVTLARLQVFNGQYDDAILNAQNALLKNPNNPMAHALEGWAMGFKGEYLEAEATLKKALELDPNNALTHAYYAEVLINKVLANEGDFEDQEKAADHSRLAKELDPNLLEVHRARGLVLLAFGSENLPEAVSELKAAIAINDKIADLHYNLGYAYKVMEESDLAVEELLYAYTLNPKDGAPLIEAASVYAREGQFGKAAQHAEQAVKTDPANPRWHAFLGVMYYRNTELDKAIQELDLAIRGGTLEDGTVVAGLLLEYGSVPQYYWFYGFALAKNNRCTEAMPVFEALLRGVPEDETAVFNANEGMALCLGGTPTPGEGTPTAVPEEATPTP
jgi:tetratricopeptide (TPR) repeat protein